MQKPLNLFEFLQGETKSKKPFSSNGIFVYKVNGLVLITLT